MTLTFLLIGSFLAVALFAVAVRADETVNPLLTREPAGDATVVGLDAADTLTGGEKVPAVKVDWQMAPVASLRAAEELLDALERRGVAHKELVLAGNGFAVRWK